MQAGRQHPNSNRNMATQNNLIHKIRQVPYKGSMTSGKKTYKQQYLGGASSQNMHLRS